MNELDKAYYQEQKDKAKKYRDDFENDIKFNKELFKDLYKIPNLVLWTQLDEYISKYHRYDYIYHLIFKIFSENPLKPNYDILGINIFDDYMLNIVRLLWEYFDAYYKGCFSYLPPLPNPYEYQQDNISGKNNDSIDELFGTTKVNERITVEDYIEEVDDKSKIINDVLERVVNVQLSYGNTLNNQDKENVRAVIKSFLEENKDRKPIIVNLEMGKGKSVILQEFIKYMCKVDRNFSAIIVKKTIEEAREFVIRLGFEDKEYESSFDNNYEKLENEYYTNEDLFIARMIRGFNKNDCIQYADAFFGDGLINENEFTYDRCSFCKINECKVRQSKALQSHHRILVITHARLFLSNDCKEIISDICKWQNEEGEKQSRKMLIIDEKIDTFYMDTFKLKQWTEIKNIVVSSNLNAEAKKQVLDIDKYLNTLPYPEKTKDINSVSAFNSDFKFNESILQLLLSKKEDSISIINTLQKFINDGGIVGRHWKGAKDELISYYNYIDVFSYGVNPFEKCLILDATSKSDYDYCKSNAEFIRDLKHSKDYKVNIYKNSLVTASKTKIIGKSEYRDNVKSICMDIKDAIAHTKEKSLIVVYKEMEDYIGNRYYFKNDIERQLKGLEIDTPYKVIHFGQYTTGVNHLKDYEKIIIIGQLDKGTYYYNCKGLCLGKDAKEIQINEYLIDMLQQIGRTAIRQSKKVDVYMLGADNKLIEKIKNYFNAKVNEWYLENFNEYNTANEIQKRKPWYKIVEFVLEQLKDVGDYIRKSEIKEYVVGTLGVKFETYRDALTNVKTLNILRSYGITEKEDNRQMFIKVE